MKKILVLLFCFILLVSISCPLFVFAESSSNYDYEPAPDGGGLPIYPSPPYAQILPIDHTSFTYDSLVQCNTTGGGGVVTTPDLALLVSIVYVLQPDFPSFVKCFTESRLALNEVGPYTRDWLYKSGKACRDKVISIPDDIKTILNSYLGSLPTLACTIPDDVIYIGNIDNTGGLLESFSDLNYKRLNNVLLTASEYSQVPVVHGLRLFSQAFTLKLDEFFQFFLGSFYDEETVWGQYYRQLISIRSAIRDKAELNNPTGSQNFSKFNEVEEELLADSDFVYGKIGDYLRTSKFLLDSYSTGFYFLSFVFNLFYELSFIKTLLFVSLGLGVFGFVVNLTSSIKRGVGGR